jgi:hypothetical protein
VCAADWFTVDHQRAAETVRDDQVQCRGGRVGGPGARLGQSGQGGVVADEEPNAGTVWDPGDQSRHVDVAPSARGHLTHV